MKWIAIDPSVILTPSISRTIDLIDVYFDKLPSTISSGYRTGEKQLEVIIDYLKRHGLYNFEGFNTFVGNSVNFKVKYDDQEFYWWQKGWSKLLNIGVIVNPPVPAKVLYDYWDWITNKEGKREKINKKGTEIGISNHMRGNSFDVAGGSNLSEKAKRVMRAYEEGKCFITNYRIERNNNAVHVDVEPLR